jgi:hypothetical protein
VCAGFLPLARLLWHAAIKAVVIFVLVLIFVLLLVFSARGPLYSFFSIKSFHYSIVRLQSKAAASSSHCGKQFSQSLTGDSTETSFTHLSAKEFASLRTKQT